MQSALMTYLSNDYPQAMGVTRHIGVNDIKRTTNNGGVFELKDRCPAIIQPQGQGTAVIENRMQYAIEIVDIEDYVKKLAGTNAGEGKTCDFIIAPVAGNQAIVLVELSFLQSKYINSFQQPDTGVKRQGKLATVVTQLQDTINRLTACGTLISDIRQRVALFAYRLSDENIGPTISQRNKKTWNRTKKRFSANVKDNHTFTDGFVFERRLYPQPYRMT